MEKVRKSVDIDKNLLKTLQFAAIEKGVSIKTYLESIIEAESKSLKKSKNRPEKSKKV